MKYVNLDGNVLLFRVFTNAEYQDRLFIRDVTKPETHNCWEQIHNPRQFIDRYGCPPQPVQPPRAGGITAEQAERLCACVAAASLDIHGSVALSEVTYESIDGFSPERVQELIRGFVYSEDNK
jgi:hypothetical protein